MSSSKPSKSSAWRSRRALPVALAIVCTALAVGTAGDPQWHAAFDWRRDGIAVGQWWRLVSGHLVHLSTTHATLDIAAMLLVAWIFGDDLTTTRQLAALGAGIAAIDGGLWVFDPDIGRYAGLSGVLHAWFAAGATTWLLVADRSRDAASRRVVVGKRVWGATLLVGLAVKLYIESRHVTFWLDDATFPVVTAAHRWGAAAGVVVAVAFGLVEGRARLTRRIDTRMEAGSSFGVPGGPDAVPNRAPDAKPAFGAGLQADVSDAVASSRRR